MGLLLLGHPLDWRRTQTVLDYVKNEGILQFIKIYQRTKDRRDDSFKCGDEVEYLLLEFDHRHKKVRVALRAHEILEQLSKSESEFAWHPEYANFMLESTPGVPYNGELSSFKEIEINMRLRRLEVAKFLRNNEILLTMGNFPRTGCADFTSPTCSAASNSLHFPDEAISNHPRFRSYTQNICQRRSEKISIKVPIYQDEKTSNERGEYGVDHHDNNGDSNQEDSCKTDINMDAIGFGFSCCCLQVTMQAADMDEARWMYDQLTPLTPILMALSASTPIFGGYLSDVDCRWDVIEAAMDDRTPEERCSRPSADHRFRNTKLYLHPDSCRYNDVTVQYDKKYFDLLKNGGVDDLLTQHVANLFNHDPVTLLEEYIYQDGDDDTEHFESIQSSVWTNIRFKPPPLRAPEIGWRIEFRTTEVQLTDFENAAYVCFVVLLARMILFFRLTLTVPMSNVHENMARAQKRNAVLTKKFHFRRLLTTTDVARDLQQDILPKQQIVNTDNTFVEMNIDEVVNGMPPNFPGLVPLIHQYLDALEIPQQERTTVDEYLKFIQNRANGTYCTLASWMRHFVLRHPSYKKDSVVSDEICYDLIQTMDDITRRGLHSTVSSGDSKMNTNDLLACGSCKL